MITDTLFPRPNPYVQAIDVTKPLDRPSILVHLDRHEYDLVPDAAERMAIALLRALPNSLVITDQDLDVAYNNPAVTVSDFPHQLAFTLARLTTMYVPPAYAQRLAMNILRALSHVPGWKGSSVPEIEKSEPKLPAAATVAERALTVAERFELIKIAATAEPVGVREYALRLLRIDAEGRA